MTRRQILAALPAAAAAQTRTDAALSGTALCLNEDNSHFFFTRAGRTLDDALVDSFIDQYAGTQVRELMLCVNSMRTSYASKVWDPVWRGYDPAGPNDQPLFASMRPESQASIRRWYQTAWDLNRLGIDVYARWIARARQRGLSPWISMRMNDLHNVDDERHALHSEFWRSNPQLRRVPYRFVELTDRAFDYGRPEVREYHFKLIRELAERYDFDGFELDWMRHGFHFRPGHEAEGAHTLTGFVAGVRKLLDGWQQKRGHRIQLAARVPSRPRTAVGLGMDAVAWARKGLVDLITPTPFFRSIETDMPIELWKDLLKGTACRVAAGLELNVSPYPDARMDVGEGAPSAPRDRNTLETVRGAALAHLDRGVDRIYLFNYMDSETALHDLGEYQPLLRQCGRGETMLGKPRRHIVTFSDVWAPGESRAFALPVAVDAGRWAAFRVATGPQPGSGRITARLGVEGADASQWEVRLNGEKCAPLGREPVPRPRPVAPIFSFEIPRTAMNRGYNLVEAGARGPGRIVWAEIAIAG